MSVTVRGVCAEGLRVDPEICLHSRSIQGCHYYDSVYISSIFSTAFLMYDFFAMLSSSARQVLFRPLSSVARGMFHERGRGLSDMLYSFSRSERERDKINY